MKNKNSETKRITNVMNSEEITTTKTTCKKTKTITMLVGNNVMCPGGRGEDDRERNIWPMP